MLGLLARVRAPIVMSNFLLFRETAKSRKFSGMTGKEAYHVYGESAMKAQVPLGSRMIWASEEVKKLAGSDAPNFDAIAFLEYTSSKSFLKFATFGNYDAKARSAGLEGQWLLASTTINENLEKGSSGPAMVEIFSIKAVGKNRSSNWLNAWQDVKREDGGVMVWQASADSQLIGAATKTPSLIVVTQFPDVESIANVMATDAAISLKNLVEGRLEDYLAYQAYPTDKYQGMLSQGVE